MLITIAKYTFLEIKRSRLFWGLLIGVAMVFSLVLFAGDLAITERQALQVSIMASVFRLGSVLLVALIVISSLLREQQDKQLFLLLSMPMKRSTYFLGKMLGFGVMVFVLTAIVTISLSFFSNTFSGLLLWSFSLFLELMVIISASMFFQFTFTQVPASMLSMMGLYVFSRSLSAFLMISKNPIVPSHDLGQVVMEKVIFLFSYIFPRLDNFTQSQWLILDSVDPEQIYFLVIQGSIYVSLFSFAALFDFYRKNLG